MEEDFLVLPGESLAKYTPPRGGQETPVEDFEPAAEREPEEDAAAIADQAEAPEAPPTLMADPAPEPQPELAEAVEAVEAEMDPEETELESEEEPEPPAAIAVALPASAEPASTEPVSEPLAEAAGTEAAGIETAETETAETETAETAEDMDVPSGDAAEPLEASGESDEAAEAPAEEQAGLDAEAAREQAILEQDGPEPARIPTSLTATLREHGPALPASRFAAYAAQRP